MAGDVLLEMRNIKKHFAGVQALRGVDFSLREGEVHALIGENGAGKSTLMKILVGYTKYDEGEVILGGERVKFSSMLDALNNGISMIFQEFNSVPHLTVAENIYLNREPLTKYKTIDYKKMQRDAKKLFKELDVDIEPEEYIVNLSVAQLQLVEIVKALSYNSKIIIMDEPTSALSSNEINNLFRIVRQLKADGKSVIYISHKLEEIYEICDSATVMRDGLITGNGVMEELEHDDVIMMMVNRSIDELFPKLETEIKETVLVVENLTKKGKFKNISFELHAGEILGLSGLLGSGRTEIAEAITGFAGADSGTVYKGGAKLNVNHPRDAFDNGIAMVPEDRKLHGTILKMPILHNTVLSKMKKVMGPLMINKKLENSSMQEYIKALQLKTSDPMLPVSSLSGGNQQKVVLSRILFTDPDILILDEPTRGIDVLTKSEIHLLSSKLAQQGKAVLLISSEMPELMGMCDRIIVLHEGEITGELARSDFNQEVLMRMAVGNKNIKEEVS